MVSKIELKYIIFIFGGLQIVLTYKASHVFLKNDVVMNSTPKFVVEVVCDKTIILS
jgi:hypothetical protein